jgi:hypothetical protein
VPEDQRNEVLQFIHNGDLDQAKELLWRSEGPEDWFSSTSPFGPRSPSVVSELPRGADTLCLRRRESCRRLVFQWSTKHRDESRCGSLKAPEGRATFLFPDRCVL